MCKRHGNGALTVVLVVDQALEVVEEYQSKILKLEQAVLLKPNMKHVRRRKYSFDENCLTLTDTITQFISSKVI